MPALSRIAVPAAVLAALLALAGCAPGGSGSGTTDDGADHGTAENPFAPDPPTSSDGWTERYHDIPWLSDDLDNDDFLVTGTVDGHEVMGIYCDDDGNGGASVLSVADNSTDVEFQTATDIDVTVARSEYFTFIGIGTYALPSDDRGSHPITVSLSTSMEIDNSPGVYGKASPSTAAISLELLGVPYPDPQTCKTERDALYTWAYDAGGH